MQNSVNSDLVAYSDGEFLERCIYILCRQDMSLAVTHDFLCFLQDFEHFGFQITQQQLLDILVQHLLPL